MMKKNIIKKRMKERKKEKLKLIKIKKKKVFRASSVTYKHFEGRTIRPLVGP